MNIEIKSKFLCFVEPLYHRLIDFSTGSVSTEIEQLARMRLHAKFASPGWPWPESYYQDRVNLKSPPDCVIAGTTNYILTPTEELIRRLHGPHEKSREAIASIMPTEHYEYLFNPGERKERYIVTVNRIELIDNDVFVVIDSEYTKTRLRLTFWDTTTSLTERFNWQTLLDKDSISDYRLSIEEIWSALNTGVYSLELYLTPHFVVEKMRMVRNYTVKLET
jgi:hypothetical protein